MSGFLSGLVPLDTGGFEAPGVQSFDFPPFFESVPWFDKYMQAFAMFASDLDATTRRQLDRGGRLVELLRQPQYSPYPVEDQVVSVWAGLQGLMDEVPVDDVLRFEQEMLEYLRHHGTALRNIRETKNFDDDTAAALREQIAEFKKGFQTSEGKLLAGREEHVALEEEDVTQEQIVKQKRG